MIFIDMLDNSLSPFTLDNFRANCADIFNKTQQSLDYSSVYSFTQLVTGTLATDTTSSYVALPGYRSPTFQLRDNEMIVFKIYGKTTSLVAPFVRLSLLTGSQAVFTTQEFQPGFQDYIGTIGVDLVDWQSWYTNDAGVNTRLQSQYSTFTVANGGTYTTQYQFRRYPSAAATIVTVGYDIWRQRFPNT